MSVHVDYDNGTSIQPADLTTTTSSDDSGTRQGVGAPPANADNDEDDERTVESSQPDSFITDGMGGSGVATVSAADPVSVTPSAPRDVEALIVSSRFVTLRWKEPIRTNGPVIGYSVFYRQEGSER